MCTHKNEGKNEFIKINNHFNDAIQLREKVASAFQRNRPIKCDQNKFKWFKKKNQIANFDSMSLPNDFITLLPNILLSSENPMKIIMVFE